MDEFSSKTVSEVSQIFANKGKWRIAHYTDDADSVIHAERALRYLSKILESGFNTRSRYLKLKGH